MESVYAVGICLMASSTGHLYALIDALAVCCATLHMEIYLAKSWWSQVMVINTCLKLPLPVATAFTCRHVETFKYLGLHFHTSGGSLYLIAPSKARAAQSCV